MTITPPAKWNSAHRPIRFEAAFTPESSSAMTGINGQLRLQVTPSFYAQATLGQRVYVTGGAYTGNYIIADLPSNSITVNTPYIGPQSGMTIRLLANVNAELWAGYQPGHPGYSDIPWRKLADINQPPNMTGGVTIDVSGYLKSLFKEIKSPRIGADFRMSSPFMFSVFGFSPSTRYVMNGTLAQVPLASLTDPFDIIAAQMPIHFNNGVCVYSQFAQFEGAFGPHIFNVIGAHGTGLSGAPSGIGIDDIGGTFQVWPG
jgi:hypothetical protein